jgi:hypothetical protein
MPEEDIEPLLVLVFRDRGTDYVENSVKASTITVVALVGYVGSYFRT